METDPQPLGAVVKQLAESKTQGTAKPRKSSTQTTSRSDLLIGSARHRGRHHQVKVDRVGHGTQRLSAADGQRGSKHEQPSDERYSRQELAQMAMRKYRFLKHTFFQSQSDATMSDPDFASQLCHVAFHVAS